MSQGLEETLKEIIRIRIVQDIAKNREVDEVTKVELTEIMRIQAAAVYGPVMEVVKLLADEVGLKLEQAGGIVLPDSMSEVK